MAYLYRHIRLDKNEPFYIGISSDSNYKRAFSKRRSNIWNNITAKTNYEVEIVMDRLNWEEACIKEKEFIQLYGKITNGGILANLTDGGEGIIGIERTEEYKNKISASLKGKKQSEETILKKTNSVLGRKNTEETKKRMSESKIGKQRPYMQGGKHPNAKLVFNKQNGELYKTLKEASEKLGFKYSTLANMLNGNQPNKTMLTYINN
jgi:hypothetical protein